MPLSAPRLVWSKKIQIRREIIKSFCHSMVSQDPPRTCEWADGKVRVFTDKSDLDNDENEAEVCL
jgi:hypothetical protein